jgi:DNA replication protein DnaC
MLDWEEQQRARRSLERRLSAAHIGRFKPLRDFDWTWPKHCDGTAVDALITLDFLREAANVVFVGPNGVGKSMFAENIAHQADHSCSSLMGSAIYPIPIILFQPSR